MIYTVTFAPSLDYSVGIEKLKEGVVHRSEQVTVSAGGKGVIVSKVLTNLGADNVAHGFVGGNIGREIEGLLLSDGIPCNFTQTACQSRINVKMDHSDRRTSVNSDAMTVTKEEFDNLVASLDGVTENDIVIISGAEPKGVNAKEYEKLLGHLLHKTEYIILDIPVKTLKELSACRVHLIKLTQDEIRTLTGEKASSFKDVEELSEKLLKMYSRNVLVTMKAGGSVLVTESGGVYACHAPVVKGLRPIGCNESFLAGFAAGMSTGIPLSECLVLANAARAATLENKKLADISEVADAKDKVRLEVIRPEQETVSVSNIITYAKENADVPFSVKPLNVLDLAVMSQIHYLDLGELDSTGITLAKAHEQYLSKYPARYADLGLIIPQMYPLFVICANSKRYGGIVVKNRESITDDNRVVQFAAVTFKVQTGESIAVFKGTDDTIVGWKEDFYLMFDKPTESQTLAVQYLNKNFGRKKKERDLYVLGHSKGGNLALYSSAYASETVQDRIRSVVNFDGPGFSEGFYKTDGFKRIKERVYSVIPQLSIVGRLFCHEEKSVVVKSCYVGAYQHDLLSWITEDDCFEVASKLDELSDKVEQKINSVCARLDFDQKRVFVEGLFSLMYSTNSFTLTELLKNRAKLFSSYFQTDPETRNLLFKTFVELAADKHIRQLLLLTLSEVKVMQKKKEIEERAISSGDIDRAIRLFGEINARADKRQDKKNDKK